MRLFQLDVPAVALLGVHLSESQVRLLSTVSTVLVMLDSDEAGRKGTGRIVSALGASTRVEDLVLPAGHDPDDLSDADLLSMLAPFFLL
jgi:DNA primase